LKLNLTGDPKGGRTFTEEQERNLCDHVLQFSGMFYGEFLLNLHGSSQNEKNMNNNFKHGTKLAGKDWAQGFMRRNSELRVRKSEPATAIRILAFNKIEVTSIYDNLETGCLICKFGPNHIFSADESGFSCVQKPAAAIQLSKTGWDCHKF
jgi:hypothetical protein